MPQPHRISLQVIPHLEDAYHPARQMPSAEPSFPGKEEKEKEKDDTQEGNTAVA